LFVSNSLIVFSTQNAILVDELLVGDFNE